MIRDVRVLALGLLSLAACGATKEIGQLDEGSGDGDESESDTIHMCGFETGVDESGEGSNCLPSTSEDDDDGGTETGGCGASLCDPQPDGTTEAVFVVDGEPSPFDEVSDLELPCTIESVEGPSGPDAVFTTIALQCTVEDALVEHTIETTLPETFTLATGTQVVFSHFVHVPMWSEEWFSLRAPIEGTDALLLAGINGGTLLPYQVENGLVLLAEPFFGHVTLSVQDGVCDVEPLCSPDDCYQERRQAIAVSTDAETVVYDGNTGHVGQTSTMEVRVAQAGALENVQCTDLPSLEYRVLLANVGDG